MLHNLEWTCKCSRSIWWYLCEHVYNLLFFHGLWWVFIITEQIYCSMLYCGWRWRVIWFVIVRFVNNSFILFGILGKCSWFRCHFEINVERHAEPVIIAAYFCFARPHSVYENEDIRGLFGQPIGLGIMDLWVAIRPSIWRAEASILFLATLQRFNRIRTQN